MMLIISAVCVCVCVVNIQRLTPPKEKVYELYLSCELVHQTKRWALHMCCGNGANHKGVIKEQAENF